MKTFLHATFNTDDLPATKHDQQSDIITTECIVLSQINSTAELEAHFYTSCVNT